MVSSRSGLVDRIETGRPVSSANAVKYIRRVEELTGLPVSILSTSPERDDTILVHDPFAG